MGTEYELKKLASTPKVVGLVSTWGPPMVGAEGKNFDFEVPYFARKALSGSKFPQIGLNNYS